MQDSECKGIELHKLIIQNFIYLSITSFSFHIENAYQTKPKPVSYDYDNVMTPGRQIPKDNIKPSLVEAPRKGKQLKFSGI